MTHPRFAEILRLLATNEIDFIVVGMTAGILQGAPVAMSLSGGLSVRVLSLPALIEAKERAGRPKDLAAQPVLRATLDELKRQSG